MENKVNDLIIRIKNGYMAEHTTVLAPKTRFSLDVARKLKETGFIKEVRIDDNQMTIELLYTNHMPALTDLKIYSKPGQRHYVSYKKLKPVLGGLGYCLLSTSKGVMTGSEARKAKIGGELLFEIW